ncbi:hypothetical protein FF38_08911 [Lucilia cuprina]|uniref:Exocyst complex component Sec10-like alpha-helical bundle domain-containing protein n=1 Tax=Lucilia cuprina TaxID=7375 RepID=A0A0L0CFK3_LUCCU|nr:hypothetical protein FF38_08911 [Lucilia cuprina]
MKNLFETSKHNLSTPNLHRLINAVARNFCSDLRSHMSKYTISTEGGKVLGNDILKFERLVVDEWGCGNDITEEFALLRSIVRLYTANHSLLASLLRDSHLSKITPSQLRGYLAQRVDFNPKTMQILFYNNNPRYLYNY